MALPLLGYIILKDTESNHDHMEYSLRIYKIFKSLNLLQTRICDFIGIGIDIIWSFSIGQGRWPYRILGHSEIQWLSEFKGQFSCTYCDSYWNNTRSGSILGFIPHCSFTILLKLPLQLFHQWHEPYHAALATSMGTALERLKVISVFLEILAS